MNTGAIHCCGCGRPECARWKSWHSSSMGNNCSWSGEYLVQEFLWMWQKVLNFQQNLS